MRQHFLLLRIKSLSSKGCHPEKGDSPSRDRTMAGSADAVEKIADAAYSIVVLIHGTNPAQRRTVLHAGCAALQDDIVEFTLRFERCRFSVMRASRNLVY